MQIFTLTTCTANTGRLQVGTTGITELLKALTTARTLQLKNLTAGCMHLLTLATTLKQVCWKWVQQNGQQTTQAKHNKGGIMFVLVSKQDGSIFGDKSYYIKSYFKSERAAKAAATRFEKKFGENEFGRIVFRKSDYTVTDLDDYSEPQVTRTGRSPYNGNEITVTIGINSVGTHMDPLCESHYTR